MRLLHYIPQPYLHRSKQRQREHRFFQLVLIVAILYNTPRPSVPILIPVLQILHKHAAGEYNTTLLAVLVLLGGSSACDAGDEYLFRDRLFWYAPSRRLPVSRSYKDVALGSWVDYGVLVWGC